MSHIATNNIKPLLNPPGNLYKIDQLAAARASLIAQGKSPRQIGLESRLKIILWIYKWGYTTSTIIQTLLARTSGGYAKKLCQQGWLTCTNTSSGSPTAFYTLTQLGLSEAERHSQFLYPYKEINPYKVDQMKIRHDIIAQSSTINGLNASNIVNYETERMLLVDGDKSGQKRPDVIWTTKSGLRIGVEIELTAKWSQKFDEFILRIMTGLTPVDESSSTYSRFSIVTDSPAIIDRYKEAVKPGALLSTWIKSPRNHWIQGTSEPIPDWLINKIDFYLIRK